MRSTAIDKKYMLALAFLAATVNALPTGRFNTPSTRDSIEQRANQQLAGRHPYPDYLIETDVTGHVARAPATIPKGGNVPSRTATPHLAVRDVYPSATATFGSGAVTALPQKRDTIDPLSYWASITSLYGADPSPADVESAQAAVSSFLSANQPGADDSKALESLLDNVKTLSGDLYGQATSAWADKIPSMTDILGALHLSLEDGHNESGADPATLSGVITVEGGTAFWSASAFAETRAQVAASSVEAWDAVNIYVGTYSAPTGEMASQGVVSTNGGTTYWESANWQQSIATLSTFDYGLAQMSWMSHNVDHGWTSSAASGGDNVTDQTTSQSGATTTTGTGITTTTASSSSVFTGTDGQLSTRVGLAGGNNLDSCPTYTPSSGQPYRACWGEMTAA